MEKEFYVDNSYYDEDSNYYTIDVWCGDDEEGYTAAVVNGTTGDVWFIDNTLRGDKQVQEAIAEVQRNIRKYKFLKVGSSVRWNDPAINDYPAEEREAALAREFIVHDIINDDNEAIVPTPYSRILASDGTTEVEGFANEFEPLTFAVYDDGEEIGKCYTRKELEGYLKDLEEGDKLFDRNKVYEIKTILCS
jgi:hypothetical protein